MIPYFLLACLVIELTPGPNMTWLAVTGATYGRRAALAAVGGIALGLSFAGLVAALGLAALLSDQPWLFQALRWAGACYLLYIAWDAWRGADATAPNAEGTAATAFRRGLISNCLNPKAYAFYLAMLPQFVDPTAALPGQLALLTALFVAVATLVHAGIALASGAFAANLHKSPVTGLIRRGLAIATAGVAVWFFVSTGAQA